MKYIAKYTCGVSNNDPIELGEYDFKDEAIQALCKKAYSDDEEFENEEEIAIEALETRDYYCVGYSSLCLMIECEGIKN